MYLQLLFQFVQEVEGVLALAVHLVDEDDDWRLSHAADLHQLTGLRLHTLGAIHNYDGTIDSREGAERVLSKVLVARSVKDVDLVAAIVELHDRGCDRDAALLLNLHPVAGGSLAYLVALHGTCHLYLPAKEEQFLRQRGLAGIGMRDDGKGASAFYFLVHLF